MVFDGALNLTAMDILLMMGSLSCYVLCDAGAEAVHGQQNSFVAVLVPVPCISSRIRTPTRVSCLQEQYCCVGDDLDWYQVGSISFAILGF